MCEDYHLFYIKFTSENDSSNLEGDIAQESLEVTLSGSQLIEIDVNKTTAKEIRHMFCRESKQIFLKYAEHYKV